MLCQNHLILNNSNVVKNTDLFAGMHATFVSRYFNKALRALGKKSSPEFESRWHRAVLEESPHSLGFFLLCMWKRSQVVLALKWRHNERDGVSNDRGVSIVRSTVGSGADQRKHQSPTSLAFVMGIHRWPGNSTHKSPVTRKMFPFNDVIMVSLSFNKDLQMHDFFMSTLCIFLHWFVTTHHQLTFETNTMLERTPLINMIS